MKWFIAIKPKKEYTVLLLLIVYNQFFPILLAFFSCSLFYNYKFFLGYVLLAFAFFPIFVPLKYKLGDFYFTVV